jgi:hypothetical protein
VTSPNPVRLTEETLADIQGFLTSGYGHLPFATYLFLQIHERSAAQRWLERLAPAITSSASWQKTAEGRKIKPASAVNIALTSPGLAALGLTQRTMCTFPIEFE